MAALLAPMYGRIDVTVHTWFVPNRILWPNWNDFITGKPEDEGLPPHVHPYIEINDDIGGLPGVAAMLDYMGIPPYPVGSGVAPVKLNALPFAAYYKICNNFYRDQNLQVPSLDSLVDGNNAGFAATLELMKRSWEHDYFSSALPFAQKGQPVTIPTGNMQVFVNTASGTTLTGAPLSPDVLGTNPIDPDLPIDKLYAAGDTNTTTIADLRRAFKLQNYLELMARGGSRIKEFLKNFFNVNSSDARLDLPEYITGFSTPIYVNEVLNTSGAGALPQGNMAGVGRARESSYNGDYFCEEHGFIIQLVSVRPKPVYVDGIERMYFKDDKFDYFTPQFQHIGEQPIYNDEVMAYSNDPRGTFGYIPRYAQYKYKQSLLAGDFRNSLDYWPLRRKFSSGDFPSPPVPLSGDFVQVDPDDITNIFAVDDPNSDNIYLDIIHGIHALRPMAKYGNPM